MTNIEQNITKNVETKFNKLVDLGKSLLKVAQEQASPQDVINALDEWSSEMGELRAALPGGSEQQQEQTEQKPTPPGQKAEPAEKGATLETDTAEGPKEKVNEQNSAQKSLQSKTFSMDDIDFYHQKAAKDEQTIKALKARVDELENFQQETEKEGLAEEYSDLFPPHQRKAKYDEVISSTESNQVWATKIDAISEVLGTVKPAKNVNVWLPQKNAKQVQKRLKHL